MYQYFREKNKLFRENLSYFSFRAQILYPKNELPKKRFRKMLAFFFNRFLFYFSFVVQKLTCYQLLRDFLNKFCNIFLNFRTFFR
jgi:hypothetical protein